MRVSKEIFSFGLEGTKALEQEVSSKDLISDVLCLQATGGVVVKDYFMLRILTFDTKSITCDILEQVKKYVNNPDWWFDKVQFIVLLPL
uniref:Crinkler (CRN) n=1 Tax=Angiostrongylus cantonensis TaxID=6313 RepID=A0A0K0D844_ANGCA